MSNKRTDRLIEQALSLVRGDLRHKRPGFQNPSPQIRVETVEAHLVVNNQRSELAVSSFEIVTSQLQDTSPVISGALPSEQASNHEAVSLIAEIMAIAQTAPVAQPATGSPNQSTTHQSSEEGWLDMERADRRKRVEAFKATQDRFQQERQEYCEATMAAARTNQWKPTPS